MGSPEWQKVKGIVYEALSLPPHARAKFLEEECALDDELKLEVEVLLDSYESGFLEASVIEAEPSHFESAESLFAPGYTFSHYEIIRLLGRGGMGEVYLANDTLLTRLTAIKIIHSDPRMAESAPTRLLREARAAAKVEHPCICSVYEVGETDGRPFIAMQYVVGESLDVLIHEGSVSTADAIAYAQQIAAALSKAHSHGLVHRDVKPANVIVDADKKLKVLDFGLAEIREPNSERADSPNGGLIAGTIAYMSPEHLCGEEVDFQTDIWGLGVVFYQMLTGNMPFTGSTRAELIENILSKDPDALPVIDDDKVGAINLIVRRALEKDTQHRYGSIDEFAADLAKVAEPLNAATRNHKIRNYLIVAGIAIALAAIPVWLILQDQTKGAGLFADASGKGFKIDSLYSVRRKDKGVITDLSFSPDGEKLAFALSEAGSSAVYVLAAREEKPVRLAEGEKTIDHSPVWSPDGSKIGFISWRSGKEAIWTVASDGGDPQKVAEFPAESQIPKLRKWSNDGTRIFFDDGRGPKTIDLQTGTVTTVDLTGVNHQASRGFSISRDESAMIVTTADSVKEYLWYKSIGTKEARLLSDVASFNGMPDFLPSGDGFVYSAVDNGRFQIYVRGLDGSPPKQITFSNFSASNPTVSPNGKQIVYVSNNDQANIFRSNVREGTSAMLTEKADIQLLPKVSPNGAYLAYQSLTDASEFLFAKLQIDLLSETGAKPFSTISRSGCCVEWTPDGEAVTFIHRSGTEYNIFKFDVKDRRETQLTTGGIALPNFNVTPFGLTTWPYDWASDGSQLAFAARRSGRESIFLVSPNSTETDIVVEGREGNKRVSSPKWSHDSHSVAYLTSWDSNDASGKVLSQIMVSTSGKQYPIGEFAKNVVLLDWSKNGDGVYAALAAEEAYELIFLPIDPRSGVRQLATLKNAKTFGILMSPDMKAVSYTVFRNQVENLCVLDLSMKQERCVTSNEDPTFFYSGTTWTPDSKSLVYSRQTGGMEISLISRNIDNEENQ